MKKSKVLKSIIVMLLGVILFSLTGCTSKVTIETDGDNDIQIQTNIVSENDSDENNEKVELTKAEIKDIENFINNSDEDNVGFLSINYSNPEDFFKQIADESLLHLVHNSAKQLIRYAIVKSEYAKEPTTEQKKYLEVLDGANLISEDDLLKFFEERINYNYTKENLRKDFKFEYNEKLKLYEFHVTDTDYMEFEIKEGYKIGNKYYLNIEYPNPIHDIKTETIDLVIEKDDEYYKFYSCKNSAIKETNTSNETEEEKIVKAAYYNYIDEIAIEENYELSDSVIDNVQIVSFNEIKKISPDIEMYYPGVKDSDIFATVTYSVKPTNSVEESFWLAGDGEISGQWIKNKTANVWLVENNGEYTIESNGTEW